MSQPPIRVLHIIGNLRFGGTQVALKHIVENSHTERFKQYVYPLRSKVIELSFNNTTLIEHDRFHYDIRKFFDLIKICKKEKIDIVHTHLHKSVLGGLLLTYFCKSRIVVHEHGPITRPGLTYSLYRFLLRFLHHRSTAIIANSNAISQALSAHSGVRSEKIHVIANAVDLERFQHNPETRKRLRQKYSLQDNHIAIGFVGRLHPVKGIDCLVQAMKILVDKNPLFQLFVVGNGPLEKVLLQKTQELDLNDHIHFLGYRQDVTEIMNLFDIGCMPSRQEAFGISAIEMMSMQIPFVCSKVEGLAEITEHLETAIHLKHIDPESIAQSIFELSSDSDLQNHLKKTAFEHCRQYSIQAFVDNIESLYDQIMSSV